MPEQEEAVIASPVASVPVVTLEITADRTIGYAAIQNNVPVIRSIVVSNSSEKELHDVELLVSCSPAFATGAKLWFDRLGAGEKRKIAPIDLKPEHDYLTHLDESELATITAKATFEEAVLGEASVQIDVLAYDQWAGTRSLPELLAAFCMPNSRIVDHIISTASSLLRTTAQDVAMSGYQTKNREKVWKQVSAIYSTILAENLHYSNPPASFGVDGQKIRTPERILDGHLGTCLDLAMLFASCFEQVGLHPVVLFKEGHAWVGVWLIETCFPTAVVDDVQAMRKRVKSGEFLVFETTGVANGQKPSLRWAITNGEEHLQEETSFQYAVDIRRARELQVRPLPSRSKFAEASVVAAPDAPPGIEDMPPLPPLDPALLPVTEVDTPDTPEGRLSRWKSKLLDLTLRNRLLNFKPTKTSLRVVCPDPAALEDAVAETKEFRICPMPQVMTGSDNREAAVYAARNGKAPVDALAADALSRREIIVDLPEDKLEDNLLEIYRAAEMSLEESGANTLFLVFGLLQWQEDKDAEARHVAPILMLPVTLTRHSVRSGFRLTRHDDEPLVNPTLVQKLLQDFDLRLPSFDTLPTDEKGLDVRKILQTFRLHVAELPGWEVKDEVHLGIFSFTKYLMWKDLQDRNEQLLSNPVVAHLVNNPGQAFTSAVIEFEPSTLDATHQPQDLFAPLLSDSSQLRAICVASNQTNLVIEGPPGTGKSQTITNLIAHLLATGKTVLFVSEKMAALEVVHRRLNAIGLGPFCLELHSAKAKKADVLKQLGNALDAAGNRTVKEWEIEGQRLGRLRQELNELVLALHRVHKNDLSIYDAIGMRIRYADTRPASMNWPEASNHSRADLEILRELARQMAALASQLSDLVNHPLRAVGKEDWTPSWQQDLMDGASLLSKAASVLEEVATPSLKAFGIPEKGLSFSELLAFDRIADVLIRAPEMPIGIAKAAHDELARARLRTLRDHGARRAATWSELAALYKEDLASISASELKLQWAEAQTTWWPKRWFAKRAVTTRLRLFRQDQKRPGEGEVDPLLASLAVINEEDKILQAMAAEASALLQESFASHKTDWNAVTAIEKWAQEYSEAVALMCSSDMDRLADLRTRLQTFVAENRALLRRDGVIGTALLSYRDAYRKFTSQFERVTNTACAVSHLGLDVHSPGAIARLLALLQSWQTASRQIQPWTNWKRVRAKAVGQGLQGLVGSVEAGEVDLADVDTFFEYSYRNWWLKKAIDREPVLCAFSSADHERKIAEFRAADERFQKLSQQYVVALLCGHVPANSSLVPSADSELGKLRRELQKQRKHMPIRQLVHNLPTLLPKLKPCLLMSPLSVAQYLDAKHSQFDVVIFDEASQISVWDAVGVIARGKQLVCVGDPKQLPPTNFFNRADDSEEGVGEDDIQDLESILDECLSIGMPKLGLDWHYRSRHESLITFSNVTYYENRLVTFPSPFTQDQAVRFERIKGVYDRGGSRTNRAEAEAIVRAIEAHYSNKAEKHSLGVVTFNQVQQSLIERLLDARRRARPDLDQAIAQDTREPLFIKNLESVQGDERDVIFFSITYGPDAAGKVNLNFGPLNLDGGHRRLNVAVSRARQGVVIFSTLVPEQIDLSRVRAAGVRDLKNYLEFAIRGPRALVEQSIPTGMEPDSPFERQVINALRESGWDVHPQVGVSGYRIDIGVVDPRTPGRYLLGVECDGRTYHSGATARDRDRLRQHVLEGLGWTLHRIWSTDWWLNPAEPMRKLLATLDQLVKEEPDQGGGEPPLADAELVDTTSQTEIVEPMPETEATEPGATAVHIEYRVAELQVRDGSGFYDNAARPVLLSQLMEVINAEGPVAEAVVYRRIARAWGLTRTGRRIEELLSNLVPAGVIRTREERIFFWPEQTDPEHWSGFRVPGAVSDSKRLIDEISLEELGNAAVYILGQHGRTSLEDLARSVCRLMGISRMSGEAEQRVHQALQQRRVKELLEIGDGTASLTRT